MNFPFGTRAYAYLSEDESIQTGDVVFVLSRNGPQTAVVEKIRYSFPGETEWPVEKMRHIYCKWGDSMTLEFLSYKRIRLNRGGVAYSFDGLQEDLHITFPPETKVIGRLLFAHSSIQSIWIPEGVTRIEAEAFEGAVDLMAISIPASVTKIADDAFAQCFNIKDWNISPTNPHFKIVGPYIFSDGGTTLFRAHNRREKEFTIPIGIKKINHSAFDYCDMESLSIPEGVQVIGDLAFQQCRKLKVLHLPNSLLEIGAAAFARCNRLESIILPKTVSKVGDGAFYGCSGLKYVLIEGDSIDISSSTFASSKNSKNNLIPLMAPLIPPLQFHPKLRYNALLGFCELKRRGVVMENDIERQYLDYIEMLGEWLPREIKQDSIITSLLKNISENSYRLLDEEIMVQGNASEELKQLIWHIKENHLEDIAINGDGALYILNLSDDAGEDWAESYDFGFDCSETNGLFFLFKQVPDDDPIAILNENNIFIGRLENYADPFEDKGGENEGGN